MCPAPEPSPRPGRAPTGPAAIIYNPSRVDPRRLRAVVSGVERTLGLAESSWMPTPAAGSTRPLVERALAGGARVVVAAGGDGTVRAVGAALTGGDIPLGIIPAGTGNLLARNLGLPVSSLRAATLIALGPTARRIDAATITLSLHREVVRRQTFFVMAGFGVDSDMAGATDPALKRRIGWTAYVRPVLASLSRRRPTATIYRLDGGEPIRATLHTMLVGNCSTLAGGLRILPDALVDDGLLDVLTLVSIKPYHLARTVRWLGGRRLAGRRVTPPVAEETFPESFRYATAREITVNLAHPTEVEADGDILGTASQIRFSVLTGALKVCSR